MFYFFPLFLCYFFYLLCLSNFRQAKACFYILVRTCSKNVGLKNVNLFHFLELQFALQMRQGYCALSKLFFSVRNHFWQENKAQDDLQRDSDMQHLLVEGNR